MDWRWRQWGAGKVQTFTPQPLELKTGDGIRFTRNDREAGRINGARGEVTAMDEQARTAIVRNARGQSQTLHLDAARDQHIAHAYVKTALAAQGRTADHVIIHADSRDQSGRSKIILCRNFSRETVMARVGHLIRSKRREIERITRILRGCFDPDRMQAPKPGQIRRIILIGPYARRSWYEDKRTIDFSNYEFWIILDHPLFANERCWQRAGDVVRSELCDRCAVDLEIYSKSDIRIAKAERDTFILDRIEASITLYRASRAATLSERELREPRP